MGVPRRVDVRASQFLFFLYLFPTSLVIFNKGIKRYSWVRITGQSGWFQKRDSLPSNNTVVERLAAIPQIFAADTNL